MFTSYYHEWHSARRIQNSNSVWAADAAAAGRPGGDRDRRRSLGGPPTDAAASIRAIRVTGKSVTAVRASLRVSEMVRDPQGRRGRRRTRNLNLTRLDSEQGHSAGPVQDRVTGPSDCPSPSGGRPRPGPFRASDAGLA
jgi:hypothetical protein